MQHAPLTTRTRRALTEQDLTRIIELRERQGLGWRAIDKELGRRKGVCRQAYFHARGEDAIRRPTPQGPMSWTEEEVALLFRLRDTDRLSFVQIGRRLGRTKAACTDKYHRARPCAAPQQAVIPPREVIEDAATRAQLAPLSLTALVLGDPLPGRSALDQRRA